MAKDKDLLLDAAKGIEKRYKDLQNRQAFNDIKKTVGLSLAFGGGLGALVELYKRLREPEDDAKEHSGPVVELVKVDKQANEKNKGRVDSPAWQPYAQYGASIISTLAAFETIRRLAASSKKKELDQQRAKAQQEFDEAISQSLAGTPVSVIRKAASDDKADYELGMAVIDALCNHAMSTSPDLGAMHKRASLTRWIKENLGPLAAAAGITMFAVPFGLGSYVGWNASKKKNQHRKTIKMIKRREALKSLNSPPPAVAIIRHEAAPALLPPDEETLKELEEEES